MAIRIYIDQGHNPQSPNSGAEGNGYREQDLVYRIGILTQERFLRDPNYEVRVSRPTEATSLGGSNAESLRIRVNEANAWGADLFLSLHANASALESVSGSEGLVYARETEAYRIAEVLLASLNRATGLRNRGIFLRPGLYVLRKTQMPAVLLELGFISNPGDAALMANRPELFADGIYLGVTEYYGT